MKFVLHTQWVPEAETVLAPTLGDERASIIADVNAGRLFLWSVDDGAAWVVLTVTDQTRELCVCCIAGRGLLEVSRHLVAIARKEGLRRIRYYSQRGPGIQRLLRDLPIKEAGRVYHLELEALH